MQQRAPEAVRITWLVERPHPPQRRSLGKLGVPSAVQFVSAASLPGRWLDYVCPEGGLRKR